MSEHCEVWFTQAARKELKSVTARDPKRAMIIRALIAQVEENGWKLSTKSEVIKVLRNQTCVAEIRDLGSGGYRLFLFWYDRDRVRELWVCRVLPKRDVVRRKRINEICDAVEKIRERFLKEQE